MLEPEGREHPAYGITFLVYEAETREPVLPHQPRIKVNISAMYNRVEFRPPRGLNFSAVKIGGEKRERTFDICNEGPFDFTWALMDIKNPRAEGEAPATELALRNREGGEAPIKLTPASGTLAKGTTQKITVTFTAIEEDDYDFRLITEIPSLSRRELVPHSSVRPVATGVMWPTRPPPSAAKQIR